MRFWACVILCFVAASAVAAPVIGIFADETGEICEGDIDAGGMLDLYVLVTLDTFEFSNGITGAEFRIENLPSGYSLGAVTPQWTSDVVLGDLDHDFSLVWNSPRYGSPVLLGRLRFQVFANGWIDSPHVMTMEEGLVCNCLVVIDNSFTIHPAAGGRFTFNCDTDCGCGGFQSQDSDWGEVKTLF